MTVSCEGDCSVIEQLGEKHDFESGLTQRGYRHEEFVLHVLKHVAKGARAAWNHDYSVSVARIALRMNKVYRGGPAHDWVRQCMTDIDKGSFGAR